VPRHMRLSGDKLSHVTQLQAASVLMVGFVVALGVAFLAVLVTPTFSPAAVLPIFFAVRWVQRADLAPRS
jgi:hypothetical protein